MKKPAKSISEMTTRELRKFIRKEVKKANTKLRNIKKRKRGVSKAVAEELESLKKMGIIGKSGRVVTGYRLSSKKELQRKARELEYFNQWKGSETVAVAKAKDYKKYQAFINNPDNSDFANFSYNQWRELVEMFGALNDELKGYDYEGMKALFQEVNEKEVKVDFQSVMEQVMKDHTNDTTPLTPEALTDYMRKALFI